MAKDAKVDAAEHLPELDTVSSDSGLGKDVLASPSSKYSWAVPQGRGVVCSHL